MVVISAIVFAWMYSAYFQSPEAVATRTIGIATVTRETSILTRVTVAEEGGGSSTVTPTTQPMPEAPTQTSVVDEATPSPDDVDVAPTDEDTTSTDCASEPLTLGEGSHAFVIWAHSDVWVDVVLDDEAVFSDVITSGCEAIFYGEAIVVNSGNAQLVQIWVDGIDYGDLGDSWDATFTYP